MSGPSGRAPGALPVPPSLHLSSRRCLLARTFSLRETQDMNASSGRNSSLSGTRMVEYTTAVHVPLYIWMDPYADFE